MTRIHVKVRGRVQGVWFRAFTRETAEKLDVTGWVRNLPDGSVEALAEGDEAAIREFLDALREGPPLARVVDVQVETQEPANEFEKFEII